MTQTYGIEPTLGVDVARLFEAAGPHFGTRDPAAIYTGLERAGVIVPTGDFVVKVHPAFKIPPKKVIRELASLGIHVEPRMRVDLERAAAILGENVLDGRLVAQ